MPLGTFGNKDFYAKWTAIEYTITYHLNDEEWLNEPAIENDNAVTYTAESAVTFSNATHPHYTFKGWYTELTFDTQVTTLPDGSYGNVDLYAKWWYGTDGLVYSKQGDDYQVTGYTGSSTSVAIPDVWDGRNVTSIGNHAFYGCGLQEVIVSANVTSIDWKAFENCTNIATVNWNATNCTSVGKYSSSCNYTIFKGCTSLATVNVGSNVISIPDDTFYGCSSLKTVYYGGTQTQWGRISIGSDNTALTIAIRYYYSPTSPTEANRPLADIGAMSLANPPSGKRRTNKHGKRTINKYKKGEPTK